MSLGETQSLGHTPVNPIVLTSVRQRRCAFARDASINDETFQLCPLRGPVPSMGVGREIEVSQRMERALFFAVELRSYQIPHAARLLAVLRERRTALDASSCGTGKTYSAAWIARELAVRTLVICPKSVVPTWETILADAGVADFKVIGWEMSWRRLGRKVPWGKGSYFEFTEAWPLYIIDECHRSKDSTSMQGKVMIAAARQCLLTKGKILMLSATAADSPLWMRALGFTLGLFKLSAWPAWLDQHGCPELVLGSKTDEKRQWHKRVFLKGEQRAVMARLNEEIFPAHGARLRISEIPDFPTTQIDIRLLDGHDKQVQRLSRELKEFYDNRNTRASLSVDERAKLIFLRQAMEVAKVPMLVDMIEDALESSRVVVFANFSATLDALAAACVKNGWTHGHIRGEQDGLFGQADRQRTITEFQADRLDVVLANVQAGGVGLSLHSEQKTPRTALICPTWSAIDLRQVLGRVHRDGGGHSEQRIVFFRNTVEERVANAVQSKLDRLDLLNDGELATGQAELALQP